MILIRDATVARATGVATTSVLVAGDRVVEVGASPHRGDAEVIDAGGAWLGPGFVDLHAHLREPGQTWKEDFDSAAAAARAGGYTAVVAMPNTVPAPDDGPSLDLARAGAARVDGMEIVFAGALTRGRRGEEMADLDALYQRGVRIFSDDGDTPGDPALLRTIMKYLHDLPGAVVADHPEEVRLTRDGHLNEGEASSRFGLVGIPAVAEELVVGRDLELARDTGARLHLQHVSTAASVELIRRAKEEGVAVTAEVTPHHLTIDESALHHLDPDLKMYPPLRRPQDREAVAAALREGVIDCVATDHAPHAPAEKDVPFEEAPRGVIGLETAAPLVAGVVGEDPILFFSRMSVNPARIAGLAEQGRWVEPGAPTNLVVFDPTRRWTPHGFSSKGRNSPFLGRELTGRVVATIVSGRIVHEVGR